MWRGPKDSNVNDTWRFPTEEETKHLLSQVKKDNVSAGIKQIAIFIVALLFLLFPIRYFINLVKEPDPKGMGGVIFFSVFSVCVVVSLVFFSSELRKTSRIPDMYRRGEIMIESGVVMRKIERNTGSRGSTNRYLEICMENGSTLFRGVDRNLYNRMYDQAKIYIVNMNSDGKKWKDYCGIHLAG